MSFLVEKGSNLDHVIMDITGKSGIVQAWNDPEQAYFLSDLLTVFVHMCAFRQSIYIMLYTNSIWNKLDCRRIYINEDQGIRKFQNQLRTFHDLGFVSGIGNIFSSWKRNIKNQLAQQILLITW